MVYDLGDIARTGPERAHDVLNRCEKGARAGLERAYAQPPYGDLTHVSPIAARRQRCRANCTVLSFETIDLARDGFLIG